METGFFYFLPRGGRGFSPAGFYSALNFKFDESRMNTSFDICLVHVLIYTHKQNNPKQGKYQCWSIMSLILGPNCVIIKDNENLPNASMSDARH